MSLGLREAGFDIVRALDAWPVAVEHYNRNVAPHAEVADLSDILSVVPEIMRLAPDMIAGGPPCTDYSTAGSRREGTAAKLTLAYAIIVATVRPKWFLMENVTAAATSATWADARQVLVKAGYGLTEAKVNASFYGVPQSRRRLIVVGKLGERDNFLSSSIAAAASETPMTMRELFGSATPEAMYFPATSDARRSVWGPDESAPTIRERSIRPLPTSYQAHPDDAALIENGFIFSRPVRAGRGVRSIDEPHPTVTRTASEKPRPRYLTSPHRRDPVAASDTAMLTIEQISRVQGFPTWWQWKTSAKRDTLQMIANALPAPVAKAMGQVILERERGESAPMILGEFPKWLVRRGRSPHSARNTKSLLIRARRLLGGRTFSDPVIEMAALEGLPEAQTMRKNTLSDLRQALRLYAEFQASPKLPLRMPKSKKRRDAAVVRLRDYARQMRDADELQNNQKARKSAPG